MSRSAGRAFAWAALGAACFTAYGSLVPFQFRPVPPADALGLFGKELAGGAAVSSRSDAAANVLLGVPLGFALMGWACADRGFSRRKSARVALGLVPACALFAAAVEFAQLFTPGRNCAASDVLAQTLGAAAGVGAWLAFGQAFTARARAVWTRADPDAAARLLLAYLALLAFIQTLPFDVSARPGHLFHRFRDHDSPGGVRLEPFGEFAGKDEAARWGELGRLAKLAGLFLPVGLLAARLKGRPERWGLLRVAVASAAVAVCVESPQLVVQSRSPGVTDALVGAAAVAAGWYAARVHHEGLAAPFAFSWVVVWLALMTPVTQPPAGTPRLPAPRPFDWVPGLPLVDGEPLRALEEVLTKLVLFGLLGVIVAAWRLPPRTRRSPAGSLRAALAVATTLGLLTASIFENSQRWTDAHTPCVTDVLLGGLGAALGVLAASRVVRETRRCTLPTLKRSERTE